MILFLTSNPGGIKKENGKRIPIKFLEDNNFLLNLKKHIKKTRKFVMVASDPDNYEKNDLLLQIDIESLKLSGLTFQKYLVLDGRNKNNVLEVLHGANLIILCGGNTLIQNNFFNSINLKKYLKNIDSVIIGISAGSINAAFNVYNSPECEEDLKVSPYFKGLELTSFNIEPHFILDDLSNNDKILQRNEILKESFRREIIALPDGSYIMQSDKICNLYGDAYRIKDGIITKICDNNSIIKI